jgi:hypothetical protein
MNKVVKDYENNSVVITYINSLLKKVEFSTFHISFH